MRVPIRTKILLLSLCLCVSVAIPSGCGPKVQTTAGVPTRKATPTETALAYNDSLAQANKSVAQLVINANSTTPPLLSNASANTILTAQSRIADFDRQLTPLLQDTANFQANAAQIGLLLDEIKAAGQGIIQSDLGIADAKTKASVLAAFNKVYDFADLVVSTLHDAGILK